MLFYKYLHGVLRATKTCFSFIFLFWPNRPQIQESEKVIFRHIPDYPGQLEFESPHLDKKIRGCQYKVAVQTAGKQGRK